jgi:hypothetical protein
MGNRSYLIRIKKINIESKATLAGKNIKDLVKWGFSELAKMKKNKVNLEKRLFNRY